MGPKGWRTFAVDLAMVICLGAVAALIVWKQEIPDPNTLLWLGTAYAAIAGKGYLGKKEAGKVEIQRAQVAATMIEPRPK